MSLKLFYKNIKQQSFFERKILTQYFYFKYLIRNIIKKQSFNSYKVYLLDNYQELAQIALKRHLNIKIGKSILLPHFIFKSKFYDKIILKSFLTFNQKIVTIDSVYHRLKIKKDQRLTYLFLARYPKKRSMILKKKSIKIKRTNNQVFLTFYKKQKYKKKRLKKKFIKKKIYKKQNKKGNLKKKNKDLVPKVRLNHFFNNGTRSFFSAKCFIKYHSKLFKIFLKSKTFSGLLSKNNVNKKFFSIRLPFYRGSSSLKIFKQRFKFNSSRKKKFQKSKFKFQFFNIPNKLKYLKLYKTLHKLTKKRLIFYKKFVKYLNADLIS